MLSALSLNRFARCALQSFRYRCSALGVTAADRPLLELAARSEFSAETGIARIG